MRAGTPAPLEPKAYDLLVLLASRSGELVTRQEVLDRVWAGVYVTDNAVARVIAQVRRVLGDSARGLAVHRDGPHPRLPVHRARDAPVSPRPCQSRRLQPCLAKPAGPSLERRLWLDRHAVGIAGHGRGGRDPGRDARRAPLLGSGPGAGRPDGDSSRLAIANDLVARAGRARASARARRSRHRQGWTPSPPGRRTAARWRMRATAAAASRSSSVT